MSSSSQARGPVELLADEFLARHKRGEKPTIGEYCAKHPDLAEEIRDVFEALLMVEELKPGSEDASGSFGDSVRLGGKRLERIADYRILREIGRGGMGVVYEAEHEALGRRVALKVLPRTLAVDGKALIRFEREAKAAARMHHTNIVPVFDVGQDEGHVFYAMQLIHGQGLDLVIDDLKRLRDRGTNAAPLSPRLGERGEDKSIAASLMMGQFEPENLAQGEPAPAETAAYADSPSSAAVLPGQSELSSVESDRRAYYRGVAQIGLQTASALAYAHARGIIHRDIKPGNLLLDAAGNVWVSDFGLAKTSDSGMTHTGDILGTIRYMSPERFRGQCDVRADVYALGLTLYELLVFKPAYASADRLALIEQIRQTEPLSPRSLDPRIPRDLETIVVKAIDKDPRRRYQSADELVDDLQRYVADEPIKARRIGPWERFLRWRRRNPAVAGLSAAVVLLMALGTSLSAWQAVRANAERDRALAAEQKAIEEKQNTYAVLDFLQNGVLGPANPERHPDRELTLRKVLDRAALELKSRRPPPLVEAAIRVFFGETYLALGEPLVARQHLEEAWKIRADKLGEEHVETALALALLARTHEEDRRGVDEAERMMVKALDVIQKARGEEHPDTLRVKYDLAVLYFLWGIPHYNEDRMDDAVSQERLGRAQVLLEKILDVRVRDLREEHPDTLRTMNTLGVLLISRHLPGDDNFNRGEALLRRVLEIAQPTLGKEHPITFKAMARLGRCCWQQGRLKEGESLCKEALDISGKVLGSNHFITCTAARTLRTLYREQGKYDLALPHAEAVLKAGRPNPGTPRRLLAYDAADLGHVLLMLGKLDEAKPLLEEGYRTLADVEPEHWAVFQIQQWLGGYYLGKKDYAKAEPLLLKGYEGMKKHAPSMDRWNSWRFIEALERIVQFYEAYQPSEAAKWREELKTAKSAPAQP